MAKFTKNLELCPFIEYELCPFIEYLNVIRKGAVENLNGIIL